MKKIFIVKVILVSFLFIFTIKSYSQDDISSEFNYLDGMCKKHTRTPDSLLFYSKKLLDFSQKHNLETGEKIASRYLGKAYWRLRKFEKSNYSYYNALTIAKQSGDDSTKVQIYNDLSINHRATKYYDSAIFYSRKLIAKLQDSRDIRHLNMSYMNLGVNFYLKSELDSAQLYLIKSNKGFKEAKNLRFLSSNLSMLGEIYFQRKHYKKALIVTDSSQKMAEDVKNKPIYRRNYNLLARIHEKLENFEEFERYSKISIENTPKRTGNFSFGNENESVVKSRYKQERTEIQKLKEKKVFYKASLFKILFLSILLLLCSFYLYRRFKKSQKEVASIQEKLNDFTEKIDVQPKSLMKLKCNAVIDTNKLQYIKSEGHYLEFYIEDNDKPEIDRNTMIKILEDLPSSFFVRVHKSFIVNIKYIKIINSTKLMLNNGTWINLSRTYKQQLKEILNVN